jgi:hypothetical protein
MVHSRGQANTASLILAEPSLPQFMTVNKSFIAEPLGLATQGNIGFGQHSISSYILVIAEKEIARQVGKGIISYKNLRVFQKSSYRSISLIRGHSAASG